MAQFEVATSALEQEAAGLRNLKSQLEQEIMGMRSISNQFLNMWEGEAKQAFVNSVNQNMNLLNAFTNNMEKFANALTQGASTYVKGENDVKRIVSSKGQ